MARYIDYDKVHNGLYREIFPKYIENSPNRDELWKMFCATLGYIEVQEKVTDWDSRKKLLQPRRGRHDWDVLHTVMNAVIDDRCCTHEDWDESFRDWLADYMAAYDLGPTELLMEPLEEEEDGDL